MKGVSGSSINGVKSGAEDIRCPACGSAHPNPVLKETYRYCMNCSSVMREAKAIDLSKIPKASGRLLCIAASYGHLDDASKAINVRELIQAKVGKSDRIQHSSKTYNLLLIASLLAATRRRLRVTVPKTASTFHPRRTCCSTLGLTSGSRPARSMRGGSVSERGSGLKGEGRRLLL